MINIGKGMHQIITPPNSRINFYKEHNGLIEESTVVYDNAGRQKYRVDYTNHGKWIIVKKN